jgi:hypothetical protein
MAQPEETLPPAVADLLSRSIETYEQLEALLLLRSSGDRSWDAEELGTALNLRSTFADAALEHLAAQGLVSREASRAHAFRYAPRDTALRETVERLAESYENQRLEIMQVMSANAIERMRIATMRRFADAFLLRRKDDDG